MKKLTLSKETLHTMTDEQSQDVNGGIYTAVCSGYCSNRRTCFTHFVDCSTSPNILC